MNKYLRGYTPEPFIFNIADAVRPGGEIALTGNTTIKIYNGDYNVVSGTEYTVSSVNGLVKLLNNQSFIEDVSVSGNTVSFTTNTDKWLLEVEGSIYIPVYGVTLNNIKLETTIDNSNYIIDKYSVDNTIGIDLTSEFHLQNITSGSKVKYSNIYNADKFIGSLPEFSVLPIREGKIPDLMCRVLSDKNIIDLNSEFNISLINTDLPDDIEFIAAVYENGIFVDNYTLEIEEVVERGDINDYVVRMPDSIFLKYNKAYIYYKYADGIANYKYKSAEYLNIDSGDVIMFINKYGGYSYLTIPKQKGFSSEIDRENYIRYNNFIQEDTTLNVNIKNERTLSFWSDDYTFEILKDLQKSNKVYLNKKEINITKFDLEESNDNLTKQTIVYKYTNEN